MTKFQNKYRVESNRLQGWDYSSDGLYFITIVTANRKCLFGEIKSGEMIFNDFGIIVCKEWFESFEIREELYLDEFILMPNHLNAIIILDRNGNGVGDCPRARPCVSSTSQPNKNKKLPFERKPKSISSFVAGFKSATINKIDDFIDENNLSKNKFNRNNPLWQSNYHDRIIRNNIAYYRIKNYIINNPLNWKGK